jgi:hypothetical protein
MNNVQIISLIAAVAMSFFYIKDKIKLPTAVKKEVNQDTNASDTFDQSLPASVQIRDVVEKWADLKNMCEKLELNDAVDQLDAVFPLFVKKK